MQRLGKAQSMKVVREIDSVATGVSMEVVEQ